MKEGFKEVLYANYQSTHSVPKYGNISLKNIRNNFSSWSYYYKPHLPKSKNATILDIGCGIGSFVYFLRELGYENVVGIDISKEQIDAGTKLGITGLRVEDLSTFLNAEGIRFDFIIARDVIEHFSRQEAFDLLVKISSVLNIGGKFLMQVPNGQGLFYTSIFYGDYTHEMAYTESSIRQLMTNCGFGKVACYPTGPVPHSFFSIIRSILWWLKVQQLKFWKMVETGSSRGIFTSNIISVSEK